MKNILKTFLTQLVLFAALLVTFWVVYAAWDDVVNSGDPVSSSSWNKLVEHTVPSWAIMPFNLSSCPTWWSAADWTNGTPDLRGTFVRGIWGDINGRDIVRSLWSYQADETASHLHNVDPPSVSSSTAGNHGHIVDPPNTYTNTTWNHSHRSTSASWSVEQQIENGSFRVPTFASTNTSAAWNHRHTVNIGAFWSAYNWNHAHSTDIPAFNSASTWWSETRPKNVALLYCIKD